MDRRFEGHWNERIAAHWQEHAPALTRLREALDRAASALAPTADDRARLEAFLGSESAPGIYELSSYIAVSPARVDLAGLVQAVQELRDAGAALPRPPGCPMEDLKYEGLPVDLMPRYFGTWDQVRAVVGQWPTSDDAEVSRAMARALGGSDKASFRFVRQQLRPQRKSWYLIYPETWRELTVPQRHRWLWWRHQRVIALECPEGHRRELRGRAAWQVVRAIHRAAAQDVDVATISGGIAMDDGGDIRCPSCGRSYRYAMPITSRDDPQ